MASCVAASHVDQLPPPPPHSAAIVSDAGEPTSASQVDPEAQLPPPTDDPSASFLEKLVPVVLQLSLLAAIFSDTGEPTPASRVDPEAQLPPPPPPTDDPPASFLEKVVQVVLQLSLLAAIFSDTGEPTPASQVDPEAQLPPPPTDDPPASLLEKVLPVVLQLMAMFAGGPTTRNHGHELAFKLYHLVVVTIYGFDIILVICLIARFAGIDRPWVRQAAIPLISGVLALSVATAVLGTVIDLLP